jgi:hypothetical protein
VAKSWWEPPKKVPEIIFSRWFAFVSVFVSVFHSGPVLPVLEGWVNTCGVGILAISAHYEKKWDCRDQSKKSLPWDIRKLYYDWLVYKRAPRFECRAMG